jgi:hypothetical protein
MVPFATSAARVAFRSKPRAPLLPSAPGLLIDTRVDDDFDEADAIPTVDAVSATVVITIAAIFFFDDIEMSPVSLVSTTRVVDL